MRLSLKQFAAIAGLTALEAMRQPICLLLTACAVVLMGIMPLIVTHGLGESGKLIRDTCFATHLLLGLGLATYAACLTIVQEIKRGTASAILSKPVSREMFLLAKFAGIGGLMALFSLICTLCTMISQRTAIEQFNLDWWSAAPLLLCVPIAFLIGGLMNYFAHRAFVSNAFFLLLIAVVTAFVITGFKDRSGAWESFGASYAWRILAPSVLIAMAIQVLQAISVGLATRLEAVPTLAICTLLFLLGLGADYFIGQHAAHNFFAGVAYRLIPNWQHFWQIDALTGGGSIPGSYMLAAGKYAVIYLAGVLLLSLGLFRFMEIK